MRSHWLLGIDLGTSSVKAAVLDPDGVVAGAAEAAYPLVTTPPGAAESDPGDWWTAMVDAVQRILAAAPAVPTAIGLAGQMHGIVLADEAGRPLRPAMLWPDTRAAAELGHYRSLPPDALARLANPLSPGMAGPILRWLLKNDPNAYRSARWALAPKDWLRLRLTGEAFAEPSDASATLLYDVAADRWDLAVVELLGLRSELLAPLRPSTEIAGGLSQEAADAFGLPAGLPVAMGGADTATALIGTGLVKPGALQLTIGTGGQFVSPMTAPLTRAANGIHCYRAATPSGWYSMAATLNAGLALGWVRRALNAEWSELYGAARTPVRLDDPVFLPHLAGERTPYLDPGLHGHWVGLAQHHDRQALLRSALEGVASALGDAVDAMDTPGEIRVTGGGSTDPAWQTLLADVLGRPLSEIDVPAASARGAALLAGIAVDIVPEAEISAELAPPTTRVAEPRPERYTITRERRERFRAEFARQRDR